MTFNKWLKKQIEEDTPTGDLARDVARDPRRAPANNKKAWIAYFDNAFASDACKQTFENAWNEYLLTVPAGNLV